VFRRTLFACIAALALTAGRAEALTVHDVIELTKAGLGEPVLLALIEVDHSIFSIDTATLKQLKAAGVSDSVIVAMIRSGREPLPPPEPPPVQAQAPEPMPLPETMPPAQPQVIVIDHHDAPAPQPVFYPVAVPVFVPLATPGFDGRRGHDNTVKATIATDQGLVRAQLPIPPNCVKAQPVFWGFGGKLRPGSWEPQPIVACR